jgi:hypothetical protein
VDTTVRVSYVELSIFKIFDLLSLSETSQTDSLRIMEEKNKVCQQPAKLQKKTKL